MKADFDFRDIRTARDLQEQRRAIDAAFAGSLVFATICPDGNRVRTAPRRGSARETNRE
jgi:hypothetical protein